MPTFEITAPDGKKIQVTAPEGTTGEEAVAGVAEKYGLGDASSTPAQKLLARRAQAPTAPTDMRSRLRQVWDLPEDLAAGMATGFGKAVAGPIQAGLDIVAPKISDHLTSFVNTLTGGAPSPEMQKAYDQTGVTSPNVAANSVPGQIGQFAGQALPWAAGGAGEGLVGSILRGGAAGGLGFQPEGDETSRLVGRGIGAAGGSVLGALTGAAGSRLVGGLNEDEIRRQIAVTLKRYGEADPALAQAKGTLNKQVTSLQNKFDSYGAAANSTGNALGPIPMTTIAPTLRELADSTKGMVRPDEGAKAILMDAAKLLAPDTRPASITLAGKVYNRSAAGEVYIANDGTILSPRITQKVLRTNTTPPPPVYYSQVRQAVTQMDAYLAKVKPPPANAPVENAAITAVRDAQRTLASALDEHTTSGVKGIEKKATSFYEKNLAPFNNPKIQAILTESDPLVRANTALDVALGDDLHASETVAGLVGKKGRDAIRQGIIKKALDAARGKDRVIDPVKFTQFFEKKPGLEPWENDEMNGIVGGIKNLLADGAESRAPPPRIRGALPRGYGIFAMTERLLNKDFRGAAIAGSAAFFTQPIFHVIDSVLSDTFGRRMIIAASRVKPGSPQMARITQTIAKRFAPAIGGSAIGQAAPMALGQQQR